ncbi:hypothetical protein BGZ97_008826 [Linnemannia gamsii]|uniref:Uncharacterized protein n=1 Tax=Linnemannia gamsii TaxID=64522 RepID=A0A9P6RK38_9FUNG|nr:hypothetical protein BGZ97_008826 [Linnemannia gamsii]
MDACSRADFDAVLKVLDSTLVKPRLSLEESAAIEAASLAAATAVVRDAGDNEIEYLTISTGGGGGDRHGKRRQSSLDPIQSRHDSIGTGSEARFLDDDLTMTTTTTQQEVSGAGVGAYSSHRASAASAASRDRTLESSEEVPLVIHRSSLFRPRSRVSSDGGYGRALTSALLAICFRRDGYATPEAELDEELRAVPIVRELLKYDCMLTAQSLGQAMLGVAYSRSAGSLKRAREQRLLWRRQLLHPHGTRRHDRSVGSSTSHSRRDSISQGIPSSDTSAIAASTAAEVAEVSGQGGVGLTESVMDLLLERVGPREWLKLIKCYLQRQEFDDLTVVLERCPFKGPQLETRNKDQQQDKNQQQRHYNAPGGIRFSRPGGGGGYNTTTSTAGGGGASLLPLYQSEYDRQRAREMICRETGICGIGTRIGHFNGRGIGQASYNVSSTLYEASRVLFSGSGTRFSNSYMLPRGGFRGIGGNSSGHTGSPSNSTASQVVGSAESLHATEDPEVVPHLGTAVVSETNSLLNQTPSSPGHHHQQQQQQHQQQRSSLRPNSQDQDHQPFQPQSDPSANRFHVQQTNYSNDGEDEDGDDSNDSNDDDSYDDGSEEDDPEYNIEQFESHDSNFAFGGVGSSTTSSSRPGPGIVGIAIQVQAPEHILNALLKMGFRFFSICDLSISDSRHPLALQFRQQEKMNRQLIEFCMVPNLERLHDSVSGIEASGSGEKGKKGKGKKGRNFDKRDESRYNEADREAHALVVQAFLYPAANNSTRGWSSIPALPSMMVSSIRIPSSSFAILSNNLNSNSSSGIRASFPFSCQYAPTSANTGSYN